MTAVLLLALAALFALATVSLGWWAVPLLAALLAPVLIRRANGRAPRAPLLLGAGAALGWVLLLLREAARGPIGAVAVKVGAVVGVPGPVFVLVTLLFPFALGWAAARVVAAAVGLASRGAGTGAERDAGRGGVPAARETGLAGVPAGEADTISARR